MEVTPELSDGYEGIVRKLTCLACQKPFYIAKDAYERIHPQYCHTCSLKRIGAEHGKIKNSSKEAFAQAEQNSQAGEMKIEGMSPEDKMVLYAVLQEMADELRRTDRERRKQQGLQKPEDIT